MVNFINLAKLSFVLPAAVSSLWLVNPVHNYFGRGGSPEDEVLVTTFATRTSPLADEFTDEEDPQAFFANQGETLEARAVMQGQESDQQIVMSRTRIERILGVLNRVAEASMQMDPDRASQLEPVILDLAEQAMALSNKDIAIKASTLKDLERIESTVQKLSHAVADSIEPEMQL